MPGFVRSKKDEVRWSKAKSAVSGSRSKQEESFSDIDWALVNHIYHKMNKSNSDDATIFSTELEKLLKQGGMYGDDDEDNDWTGYSIEGDLEEQEKQREQEERAREYEDRKKELNELLGRTKNPAQRAQIQSHLDDLEREVSGDLEEHPFDQQEPKYDDDGDDEEPYSQEAALTPEPKYQEAALTPEPKYQEAALTSEPKPTSEEFGSPLSGLSPELLANLPPHLREKYLPASAAQTKPTIITRKPGQPDKVLNQPSKPAPSIFSDENDDGSDLTMDQITALRAHTRPWQERADAVKKLNADARKNPHLARDGHLIEARNSAHKDKQQAYREMTDSDAYKNADPITQMEMDDKFHSDWHNNNPDHAINAINAHAEAHKKGEAGRDIFQANKDAKIRTILAGGAMPEEVFSTEAGLQHAGGAKGEEGTVGSMVTDPYSAFAMGNQEFIKQYANEYAKKAKKITSLQDLEDYTPEDKRDINRILGTSTSSPVLDQFFKRYNKLIGINARKVLNTVGLQENHPNVDLGLLHEAGMHGLIQAVNTYDPSKGASFRTHASNSIRGLQMTALKGVDEIPEDIRRAAKIHNRARYAAGSQPQPSAPTAQPPVAATPLPMKPTPHQVISSSSHPKSQQMAEAIKRIDAQKKVILRKK